MRGLPGATRYRRKAEFLRAELAEQTLMLDVESGRYFALDAVGSRIWALLESSRSLPEICAALCLEYDVDPTRCEIEVADLMRKLDEAGLVDVVPA